MTDDTYTDTLGRTYAKRQPSEASRAFSYSRKPRKRGPATSIAPVEFRPYDADPTPQPMIPASRLKAKLAERREAERKAKEVDHE